MTSTTTMSGINRTLYYQYDADGNRLSIMHPDGIYFGYQYDGLDRVSFVNQQADGPLSHVVYDNAGRRNAIGQANSTTTVYYYDAASRLQSLIHDHANNEGQSVTETLAYNPASQITTRSSSNDGYAFTSGINASRSYATNGLNQYTAAGPASFAYDADGNLTYDGTTYYAYDAENRLTQNSNGVTLAYDPLGRLWKMWGGPKGEQQFLYDGDRLTVEYDGSNNVLRRYVHGPGEDEPLIWYEGAGLSDRRTLEADHQGSIISVSDIGGNLKAVNAYDEYGIPNSNNLGRFQYTGQAWIPELGMYYYKARMYSPTLGRFMQTDPIGYKDQVNLYAYAGNDPVNGRDATGECTGSLISKDDGSCVGASLINPGLNGAGFSIGEVPGQRAAENSSAASASVSGNNSGSGSTSSVSGKLQDISQQPSNSPKDIIVTALGTFNTAQEAALAALAHYNPISILTNTEMTGSVYKVPLRGYIYLQPRHNGAAGNDNTPICFFCSAFYHTHGSFDPRFDNENFSKDDRNFAGSYGVPIYLATPSGAVKVYNPNTGYEGPPK